jgi:hypothetical protein
MTVALQREVTFAAHLTDNELVRCVDEIRRSAYLGEKWPDHSYLLQVADSLHGLMPQQKRWLEIKLAKDAVADEVMQRWVAMQKGQTLEPVPFSVIAANPPV